MRVLAGQRSARGVWRRRRRGVLLARAGVLLMASVLVFGAAGAVWYGWWRGEVRAAKLLRSAQGAARQGHHREAERAAREALSLDSDLSGAALLAAESAAALGRIDDAFGYLQQVDAGDSAGLVQAGLLRADWCLQPPCRLSQAEHALEDVLAIDGAHPIANERLAQLLGMCGRRRAAAPHVLQLIRQGVETDLLVLLAMESGGVEQVDLLVRGRNDAPEDPAPLCGLAWHASVNEDHEQAVALLREALTRAPDYSDASVALGQELLELQRFDELIDWERSLTPAATDRAEVWFVRGAMAEHQQDADAAIRCYWEAARRCPEMLKPHARLSQLLFQAGRAREAEQVSGRVQLLVELNDSQNRVLLSGQQQSVVAVVELASAYERAGRLWEALAWSRLAASVDPASRDARDMERRIAARLQGAPLELTVPDANVASSIDLSMFPLPRFTKPATTPAVESAPGGAPIAFRDDAAAAGLNFQYFNGTDGEPTRRMYEFTGGGVGVLDFDRDAYPDLYLTQGRVWPPSAREESHRDRLFRNRHGIGFLDATEAAEIHESEFGQGLAAADYNADGFPDLLVGNIGPNRLWLNNGDGTFSDATSAAEIEDTAWTTSCLMADLSGDALPDIYAVNYLSGDDVFDRVCEHPDGGTIACLPIHFDSADDRLWRNSGGGACEDRSEQLRSIASGGKGLGIAAWDADGSGRLSVYVANDTTPNFFLAPKDDAGEREETGIATGLALNADGKAEGSMGIALGDLNFDGKLDLHVTNFLAEGGTLYLSEGAGFFEDRTADWRLHQPTVDMLGFGTQFLDADRDGALELFIANGHVDDLQAYGKPYKMRPQVFRCRDAACVEIEASRLGPYFEQRWLGRAAARVDWNSDDRDDLVVGHLYAPTALLTNTTAAPGGFLALEFVGVASERDAFGAAATIRAGGRTTVHQLTAGDGYQCCNQHKLIIGLGGSPAVEELAIHWPSGRTQTWTDVAVSQRLLLVEGEEPLSAADVR